MEASNYNDIITDGTADDSAPPEDGSAYADRFPGYNVAPARAAVDDLAAQQGAVVAQLHQLIAQPPTPPDYAEAGIDVTGEDASFARRLPDVQANLNKLRGQAVGERAAEARGVVGSRLSGVAGMVASRHFSALQRRMVLGFAIAGLLLIGYGLVSAWLTSLAAPPPIVSEVAPPTIEPTLPPPPPTLRPLLSPTPAHRGLEPPQELRIPALGETKWTIMPVLAEQWRGVDAQTTALFPTGGGELRHMGAYPSEPDNLILLGGWQGFGDSLEALQLNDWLIVTDRDNTEYRYVIVPCDTVRQRKECTSAKTDLSQLGHTTVPIITLVASRTQTSNYIIRAVGGQPASANK